MFYMGNLNHSEHLSNTSEYFLQKLITKLYSYQCIPSVCLAIHSEEFELKGSCRCRFFPYGAHPASYPMSKRGSLPGGKVAEAWSWPLTSN